MISIYAKHFFNEEGREYFDKEWIQKLKTRLASQEGFLSVGVKTDAHPDCRYMTLRFDNEDLLSKWAAEDDHQALADLLLPYRTQDWYVFKTDGAGDPPKSLDDWQKISKDN